jgi:molecular chaperone Hsp33
LPRLADLVLSGQNSERNANDFQSKRVENANWETKILKEEKSLDADVLIHGLAADETVRCMAAVTTSLVSEAAQRHKTSPTVTAALGRTLTGTLLLGASLKELDRLTVQIVCDGPIGGITAEANAKGDVRGYVRNPDADAPLNHKGKLNVRGVVGKGMLYVMREAGFDIGFRPEPYRGSVPIVSGEIAEDLAYYLTVSEQISSSVQLGVHVRKNSENKQTIVTAAGGVMLQLMPGASDKTITEIEDNISNAQQSTTGMIQAGAGPSELLRAALGKIEFEILEERSVRFACPCSRERAVLMVSALDIAEIESMLREDKGARLSCPFCSEVYTLDEATLEKILQERESALRQS